MLHINSISKLGDPRNNPIAQKQMKSAAFKVAWDECLLLIEFAEKEWSMSMENGTASDQYLNASLLLTPLTPAAPLVYALKKCSVKIQRLNFESMGIEANPVDAPTEKSQTAAPIPRRQTRVTRSKPIAESMKIEATTAKPQSAAPVSCRQTRSKSKAMKM